MRPFAPWPGATVKMTAAASSARVQFQAAGMGKPGAVRVHNAGSVTAFLEFGGAAVAATLAAGMPVPAGAVETFGAQGGTHLAGVTAAGSTELYVTPGDGV